MTLQKRRRPRWKPSKERVAKRKELLARWEDGVPRAEYPRPQFVRRDWQCLNGLWSFAFDGDDMGLLECWQEKADLPDFIIVPFAPQTELSGKNQKDPIPVAWYARNVEISEAWLEDNQNILLHFSAVEDLNRAMEYSIAVEARRQQVQGRGVLEVRLKNAPPIVDGKLDDWDEAAWVEIDKSGVGANFNSDSKPYDIAAAVSISGDRLFAAWKTGNAELLKNSGENVLALFKTGGALDVMLGTNPNADPKRSTPVAGDIRLLIAQVKGKPVALIYRAVVPGTTAPIPFSSPWRTITLDRVDNVSDQIQLAGSDGNYEISIPLAALGLKTQAGQSLRGDIGVLRGDGAQTTARTYWSNKATGITADVPSEAMLTPNLWGEWRFQ